MNVNKEIAYPFTCYSAYFTFSITCTVDNRTILILRNYLEVVLILSVIEIRGLKSNVDLNTFESSFSYCICFKQIYSILTISNSILKRGWHFLLVKINKHSIEIRTERN